MLDDYNKSIDKELLRSLPQGSSKPQDSSAVAFVNKFIAEIHVVLVEEQHLAEEMIEAKKVELISIEGLLTSSSSGVQADQTCIDAFQLLKLGKKLKFIVYKLSDDQKHIVVEKQAESGTYDDFLSHLPGSDCRWAVYDFDYSTPDGERNKIVFYSWAPEDAKIKSKMLYSSSKEALRKSLTGVGIEIQGTSADEVDYDTVMEKVLRR
ncbi:cofilin [Dissophora globulifera]|nr:cofilin [Dissophora globulifera]